MEEESEMRSGRGDKNGQNGHIWPKYEYNGNVLINMKIWSMRMADTNFG